MSGTRGSLLLTALLLAVPAGSSLAEPVEAGYRAFERQEWSLAYESVAMAAEQGDPRARYLLSRLFADGLGVPEDPVTALTLLILAAQGDHPQAQYHLGNHYQQGALLARDPALAHRWWQRAAEQGVADAQLRLAAAYALGFGVERDREAAIGWYRRAAEQGVPEAIVILSREGFSDVAGGQSPDGWYVRASEGHASTSISGIRLPVDIGAATGLSWQRRLSARSPIVESDRITGRMPSSVALVTDSGAVLPGANIVSPVTVVESDHADNWIAQQPAEYFTLQLFSSDKRQSAERLVQSLESELPVTIFPFDRFGYRWYGVLAGSFATMDGARAARGRLVGKNGLETPWIRRFRSLRMSGPGSQQAAR